MRQKTRKIWKLYISVRSWGTEEVGNAYLPSWKEVVGYRYPVDTTSLLYNFAAVLPEVASLLNSHVERTLILNETTQYNNKVLEDESNETVKFHRPEGRMEEYVSTFQSVIEAEQQNCGPQKKIALLENEKPSRRSN